MFTGNLEELCVKLSHNSFQGYTLCFGPGKLRDRVHKTHKGLLHSLLPPFIYLSIYLLFTEAESCFVTRADPGSTVEPTMALNLSSPSSKFSLEAILLSKLAPILKVKKLRPPRGLNHLLSSHWEIVNRD